MNHAIEVFRDGRKNECPAEDGVVVQKMLESVYRSADKGGEVEIA